MLSQLLTVFLVPLVAKFYETKGKFTCLNNPSIVLDASKVNDNSCDCPDGSDEPGTAACAFLNPLSPPQPLPGSPSGSTNTTPALPGFWCQNSGHVGAYIPFSYVNDGVCDYDLCCDGSDEYARKNGAKCANRCAAIGREFRHAEKERKKGEERALKRRRALVKQARQLKIQVQERLKKHRAELGDLEAKRNRLEKELADTERAERGKVVKTGRGAKAGGKLGILVNIARQRVEELRETLDKVLDHRDDLQDKVDELETILRNLKEQYNPNFNDEGVKGAVHAWEDYAAKNSGEKTPPLEDNAIHEVLKEDSEESGVNWKEYETGDATDTDVCKFSGPLMKAPPLFLAFDLTTAVYSLEAYLPPFMRDFIDSKLRAIRLWLIDNGMLADNSDSSAAESPAVKAARDAFQTAENDLTARRNAIYEDEADLSEEYGADGIFRALKDVCISTEAGEYDYEICWMGQATQKSKKGHGNTNLGRYAGSEIETADDEERSDGKSLGKGPRTVLHYENGLQCWNGPNRRTDVWLGCAEKEEIWRVSEAEKCVYKMEVGTPVACEDTGSADEAKDEL